jgi:ubiquinone/menaquinone biosynthesis C-methylase UbiE
MTRPLSIENRWDILYRDYPDVYDAFTNTPYHPAVYEELPKMVDLAGRLVADVGSGSGVSSFGLARFARRVIGIEKEPAMLRLAREKSAQAGLGRVSFLAGDALRLPLASASVDLVMGITLALYPPEQYRDFIREGLRAATTQVVYLGIPPGWYGGDLANVIDDVDEDLLVIEKIFLDEFHFSYQDIDSIQEYGSLEQITSTYGFIFGQQAINYLKKEQKTSIHWKFRVYMRNVASVNKNKYGDQNGTLPF